MTKSEIIVTVLLRTDRPRTVDEIRREIDCVLKADYSIDMKTWDKTVPSPIANALIDGMTSGPGKCSIEYMVRDIDTILARIS